VGKRATNIVVSYVMLSRNGDGIASRPFGKDQINCKR